MKARFTFRPSKKIVLKAEFELASRHDGEAREEAWERVQTEYRGIVDAARSLERLKLELK